MELRGTVWIAPADIVPPGELVNPLDTRFWASWQHNDDGLLENDFFTGADDVLA